ncbi:MAG: winged helix-turn-helix domain-containing protein [Acidimicrobiales bacterium]|nr:winged helix-turn-helix domain-containing protein [Acidimicrobiales bacterium]
MGDGLHISLLGPVSVRADGSTITVRSRPQRIVLACLALDANRVVSTATLIDALWPEGPPPNAAGNLHSYVSKLRRLVGPHRIRREHGGYRLQVDGDAVDAVRVERLADAAEQTDARERAATLGEALSLWEGEPLAGLDDVHTLTLERTRLAALRRELDVRRMAALVDAGAHAVVLPDLREAAAQDPHDESVVALLARALHGTGRTAEALRTVSGFRRQIVEETGLEASSDLTRLEQRIVLDDPTLREDAHSAGTRAPGPGAAPATAEWPRFATPLHGREDELTRLGDLVGTQQLVTLTGTGGIGKSRLACAFADHRSAGGQAVHFLPLAALAPDDDLAARLAAALGLRVHAGQDPVRAVHERIGSGGQLLVLDNCEHVLDPVRRLVELLLMRRSDLTVLTTSRTPLGLAAECVVRIAPLDGAGDAGRDLFLDRARRVRPELRLGAADEETVRTVVRGLGGLPLAIELAAGRMVSMSLTDLAARIDDLDLLTDGRPTERHRTLRAAIDWSYRLLPDPARRLLRTLSLFPAGTDLAIVEELAPHLQLPGGGAAEVVALADASLVDADLERSARYTMLEPVRAFADERLDDAGERASACSLRAGWARRTAAWIEDTGRSPEEAAADARLRSDLVNLRAAHRSALQQGDLDTAIAISAALTRPATARDLPEVWSWALELAAHPALLDHPRCADALGAAANAAWLSGDLERGERLATDGLGHDPASVTCLQALGSVRLFLGEPEAARRLWVAASRRHGSYLPQAALAAVYVGDAELARRSLAEADAWAADVGSPTEVALCRYAWGEFVGPDPAALLEYEEAIALASGVGATFVASISRVGLASTLTANGHHRRAADEFDAVIRYWRTTGNWTQQWTTLRNVADLLDALGRQPAAERIRLAAAEAPAAAVPEPGAAVGSIGATDARPAGTPEAVVALVLAELADVRREVGIDRG